MPESESTPSLSAVPDEERSSFLEAVQAPISQDNPTGESITYDEDFREVKRQVDAISSPGAEADYEVIAERSRDLLVEKAKDLRVAGYLVVGEARVNGPEGMAEALRAVSLLIDTYWDDLYPEKRRMRGRGSALQIIADRVSGWVEDTEFEASDREPLVQARQVLKGIQSFTLEEMGEHAPALSSLANALDDALGTLPEPDPEPAETTSEEMERRDEEPADEQSREESDESSSPSSTETDGASSVATEVSTDSDAAGAVRQAASHLREQDLTNPIPYRLLRAIRWGQCRTEPPHDGGTTRLPPPREQRRQYLSGLLENGDHETLVREAEATLQEDPFHFWLDLQRLVVSALDALGSSYEETRTAVICEVALLVRRLPSLPTLTFNDGTPFANPLTQEWIESTVQSTWAESGDDSEGEGSGNEQAPILEQYQEARDHLGSGDLDDALSVMKEGAAQDGAHKDRFYRQLYTAILCLRAGEPSIAQPLLDDLDEGIEQHALDVWNPSLALKVWVHQCECYDTLAQQTSGQQRESLFEEADAAFEKICQIDASEAVSVAEQRPRTTPE